MSYKDLYLEERYKNGRLRKKYHEMKQRCRSLKCFISKIKNAQIERSYKDGFYDGMNACRYGLRTVKDEMIKYGFKAPDMTVTEFIEDVLSTYTKKDAGFIEFILNHMNPKEFQRYYDMYYHKEFKPFLDTRFYNITLNEEVKNEKI